MLATKNNAEVSIGGKEKLIKLPSDTFQSTKYLKQSSYAAAAMSSSPTSKARPARLTKACLLAVAKLGSEDPSVISSTCVHMFYANGKRTGFARGRGKVCEGPLSLPLSRQIRSKRLLSWCICPAGNHRPTNHQTQPHERRFELVAILFPRIEQINL